eukprot:Colp12_sorted_trinity150504_noHs@32744
MGNLMSATTENVDVSNFAAKKREEAESHAQAMKKYFQQSQHAFKAGNGAKAKDLSNEGKKHQSLMEKCNQEAANAIFNENNKKQPKDTIDLHGLYVKEAVKKVEERIQLAKRNGEDHLIVIVGAGNHSADGIPKIKPAIEQLMKDHSLTCTPNKPNKGCLYVEFTGKGWLGFCIIL